MTDERPRRQRTFRQRWHLTSLPNQAMVVATVVIALAAVASLAVAALTWHEIHVGGIDTHKLAEAAVQQTRDTHKLAEAAVQQENDTRKLAEAAAQQTSDTHELATQAREQSKLAGRNISTLKTEFEQENRPRMTIDIYKIYDLVTQTAKEPDADFEIGKPLEVTVRFTNVGKGTAFNLKPHAHLVFGPGGVDQIKVEPTDTRIGSPLQPGDVRTVSPISYIDTYKRESPDIDPAQVVTWDGTEPIIVFGYVSYEDESGTLYCQPYLIKHVTRAWAYGGIFNNRKTASFCPKGKP